MKGVFFAEGLELDKAKQYGIEKKVISQIKYLRKIGDLSVLSINPERSLLDDILFICPLVKSRREIERYKLLDYIDSNTDYIYIRRPTLTNAFYQLLSKIKKEYKDIVIILEIPTYPFHTEYQGLSKILIIKSIICEKKMNRVIDKIMTYSNDKQIWGIDCINASNCVEYDMIESRSLSYQVIPNYIRLTFVANLMYWHGVDRIVKGILNYHGDYVVVLNIVGAGQELENLKILADNDRRIIFHGPKSGVELTKIFNETDIAIDALGRHRSGILYNSSLKSKEYVARGIPVVSAVKTELDSLTDFPYYLKLPADDSDIEIDAIIKFYEKIYLHKNAQMITLNIRNYTKKLFDYEFGFERPIKKYLNKKGALNNGKY
ncbi:MAG: glycosyltransferase [Eubacterium limosum]|nr:glycosyltransferase [Eubacterium limosum]